MPAVLTARVNPELVDPRRTRWIPGKQLSYGSAGQNLFLDPILVGIGEFTKPILEPILVVESEVHWGYDLDFDPCPYS